VLYWTMSNVFQIGQQAAMLRLGHIGPEALDRRLEETRARAQKKGDKPRGGFVTTMMERAEQERQRREGDAPVRKPPPRASGKGTSKGGKGSSKSAKGGSGRPRGAGPNRPKKRPGR
jgi:hypothetical protein